MTNQPVQSSYLDLLPAIYRPEPGHPRQVLGQFLLAFERILTGIGLPEEPGIEELLAGSPAADGGEPLLPGIQRYFTPVAPNRADTQGTSADRQRAPAEFLHWLAGWVALSLQDDWSEEQKRSFIAGAAERYRLRGTLQSMRELLVAYTGNDRIAVQDYPDLPNYVQVELQLGIAQPPLAPIPVLRRIVERQQRVARAIIEQEKPAQTAYQLRFSDIPTMQIGTRSTIGVDTWLGAPIASMYVSPPDETIQVGVRSTVGVDTAFGPVPQQ